MEDPSKFGGPKVSSHVPCNSILFSFSSFVRFLEGCFFFLLALLIDNIFPFNFLILLWHCRRKVVCVCMCVCLFPSNNIHNIWHKCPKGHILYSKPKSFLFLQNTFKQNWTKYLNLTCSLSVERPICFPEAFLLHCFRLGLNSNGIFHTV